MHIEKRLRIIFIITVCTSWLTFICNAQTLQQTYAKADSLMQLGRYAQAKPMLKRLTYFSTPATHTKIYAKAGACYEALQEYNLAAEHYSIAARFADSLPQINTLLFNEIRTRTLEGNGVKALSTLKQLEVLDSNEQKRFYFYTAVNYLLVNRQDSSMAYFTKLAATKNLHNSDAFLRIIKKHGKVNKPNPKMAKALSYILPGAGQMYSGDVKNSINSLVINGVFFTLFYNTAVTYSVVDAFIGVSGWTLRYYKGGAKTAYHIAEEKQREKREEVLQQYVAFFAAAGL